MDQQEILKTELLPGYSSDSSQIKVSAERLQLLGVELKDRYDAMKNHRERSDWESEKAAAFESYHLMEDINKPLPYDGYPNLRCILPRVGCDSIHSNHMYSLFGQGNSVAIKPAYLSKDFMSVADKGAKYLTYQMNYEAGFYQAFDEADLNAHKYGIGYLEPRYCREEYWETKKVTEDKEEPVVDPLTGQLSLQTTSKTKTVKEKKTKFDGIKIESIPVEDIFVSPFIRDLEQAAEHDVVFKRTYHRFKTVKRQAKKVGDDKPFYLTDQVEKLNDFLTREVMDELSDLNQTKKQYDGFTIDYLVEKRDLQLIQANLWDDVDDDNIPEQITVVFEAKSGIVVRVAFAPCRIVDLRSRPVDGRFYGESVYRMAQPVCIEWEAIHNLRVAKGQWANTPSFFYRAGGRFNAQQFQWQPGIGVPVDDPNEIVFPQMGNVSASYFQEEQLLMNYFERLTGISENFQGVTSSSDTTATESNNTAQRAGIRMATPLARIVNSIEKLLGHMWDLNRECAPKTKEYFVVGMGQGVRLFDNISREDFSVQTKFKMDIQTVFDTEQMKSNWLLAFKMFRQDPMVMNNPATAYQLFKSTLQGLGIELDIPKPPQADQLSPSEIHELIRREEEIPDPMPGLDYDEALKQHKSWMKTEEFQEWTPQQKQELVTYYDKLQLLKQTLEASNLNKSGVFEGAPGAGPMPAMTQSKNPAQTMNTLRAGETPKSMQQNVANGAMQQ